jgi:hypothetical protein
VLPTKAVALARDDALGTDAKDADARELRDDESDTEGEGEGEPEALEDRVALGDLDAVIDPDAVRDALLSAD